jgi:putative IMPACT (imprinted ancient) family translation regulator
MKNLQIDFKDNETPTTDFVAWERIISDRGSIYSVSVGRVASSEDLAQFLKKTKSLKKHNKATHHSFAARFSNGESIYETKGDDGEAGAGNVILRMIRSKNFTNTAVCVTRWYGGIMLHRDRFKHVQGAAIFGLDNA